MVAAGVSVAVVEATRYDDLRWGESVSPQVRRPLEQLGAWDDFRRSPHLPSLGVESYWGGPAAAYKDFLFHPLGNGWHLDRRHFDAMLAERSAAVGATFWRARVVTAQRDSGRWQVTTPQGSLQAHVLLNAAGRYASFTTPSASRRRFRDHTVAVIQQFDMPSTTSGWTVVEASADGWAYSAPLPGGRQVLMLFTDPDVLRATPLPTLVSSLPVLSRRLRIAVACGSPLVRSAGAWCRSRLGGARWLSVGDAASTVDPLSGQGLHRALTDGIMAGRALLAMLDGDSSLSQHLQTLIRRRFTADCRKSRRYYRAERRWPDAPFWQRRQRDHS